MKRGHALVVERHFPTYEHVEHDAEAPHVDLGPGVDFGVEELGRGEVERAAEGGEMVDGVVEVGEAKVDELDVPRLRDKDVLDFEI